MMLWLKFFHLVGAISWLAALFYIFRLFVYHVEKKTSIEFCAQFTWMEKRLLTCIQTPAAIVALASGIGMLILTPSFISQGWFHLKAVGLLLLIGYHGLSIITHRRFARDDFFLSSRQCRILNELPTVALLIIIYAVVFRT